MSDGTNMERFLWFDGQMRAGCFPNARTLAERFEVTPRTAQRDIERFRDRFSAPLEYDAERRGYYYSDPAFQVLPPERKPGRMEAGTENLLHVQKGEKPNDEILMRSQKVKNQLAKYKAPPARRMIV